MSNRLLLVLIDPISRPPQIKKSQTPESTPSLQDLTS